MRPINLQKIKENKTFLAIFFLVFIIYFSFGLFHLAEFETVDEHHWIKARTPRYWKAVLAQDWKKTRINDKPGVSVALISGAGLFFEKNPERFEISDINNPDINRPENSIRTNKIFRLPILIFNGLFSLYLFYVLNKLFKNKWLALISITSILLSPILLGISQIVNPDSLMWIFSSATILSFATLLKSQEKKFLILTPLFLALSLLCKYSASILYPFLFLIFLSYFFIQKKTGEKISLSKIKLGLLGYFSAFFGSLLFYIFFMPAAFLKSKYLWRGTIDYSIIGTILLPITFLWLLIFLDAQFNATKITNYVYEKINFTKKYIFPGIFGILALIIILLITNALSSDFLNIHSVPFDARQGDKFVSGTTFLQKVFLEFRQLIFSLSPLILFGLCWLFIRAAFQKIKYPFITFVLSIFIIIYYLAVISQNLMANIRYSIMLYPIAIILSSIGLWDFFKTRKKNFSPILITLIIIAFSFLSLWKIKPFYFNYTNTLLPKKYIITGAWGYGGYEAAKYINSLENSENFRVWADYEGTCEFIKGFCMVKNFKSNIDENNFDYYVITRRGQILDKNKNGKIRTFENAPIWSLQIDNRPENFIQIFSK